MALKRPNHSPISADEAIARLEMLLPPGSLNDVKRLVFRCAWQGQSYGQMADAEGYDADYLREAGAGLWRSLSQLMGAKVTKRSFRTLLIQKWPLLLETVAPPPAVSSAASTEDVALPVVAPPYSAEPSLKFYAETVPPQLTRCDWDQAPDVSRFYGRESELAQLQAMMLGGPGRVSCRLVTLLGMGGMGKTSLAAKIAQQLKGEFDCVVWRCLRNAPLVEHLIADLGAFLSQQAVVQGGQRQLMECLRRQRCLVVLDNAETLLQEGASGHYRRGYEAYGDFFRALGEVTHGSCILVTSREKLPQVNFMEGAASPVQSLAIGGSASLTQALALDLPLEGTVQEREALCRACGYSPLALQLMGYQIQDLFGGSIARFLEEGVFTFDSLRRLLDEHIQRLTPLEFAILAWLAINRDWTDLATLQADLVPAVPKFQLLTALSALRGRSLVEQRDGCYGLQGAVMEYMTETIIERSLQEMVGGLNLWLQANPCSAGMMARFLPQPVALDGFSLSSVSTGTQAFTAPGLGQAPMPSPLGSQPLVEVNSLGQGAGGRGQSGMPWMFPILHSHALMKATAREYIRESQIALILRPIVHYLSQWAGDGSRLREVIQFLLDALRCNPISQSGYCAGNLIDLAICAGLEITGMDFSQLTLRQAYLCQARLHDVNFQSARFVDSTFAQVFGSLLCLDFSPDGQYVALGDALGKIQLWSFVTGQLQASYASVDGRIHCLAFSPDGQWLASGSDQGQVDVWELSTGRRLARLQGHGRFVWSLAWGPSGRWLVTGGGDRSLRLWSVESRLPNDSVGLRPLTQSDALGSIAPDPEMAVELQPEGTLPGDRAEIAARSHDPHLLRIIKIPSSWIHAVAIRPQGDLIVSGSSDGALRLWDVATGQYLGVLLGHEGWVTAVAFSPDGETIASASHDGTVRLWESDSGDLIRILKGHSGPVSQLAFSPDGCWLASASRDQSLRLWDMEGGTCCRTFVGHQGWIQAIAFSPDGQTLASGGHDRTLRLWETHSGSRLSLLQGYSANMRCVDWHPDGQRLVSCAGDDGLWFWNVASLATAKRDGTSQTGRDSGELPIGGAGPSVAPFLDKVHRCDHRGLWIARWAPDGQAVITASKDHQVRGVDVIQGDRSFTFGTVGLPHRGQPVGQGGKGPNSESHRGWVCTLRLSPDGAVVASGSADHNIHLWDRSTGRRLAQLSGHSSRVCTVSFSADGQFIFSGGADHSIRQWTRAGDYVRPFNGHEDWVTAVDVSPQGDYLASAGLDRQLKFWCLETGTCQLSLAFHDRPVTDLAWSQDGQQLATCSLDHSIHLWDWTALQSCLDCSSEGTAVLTPSDLPETVGYLCLVGHQAAVWSVSFSPDGSRLATASQDGTCKIWDTRKGNCLGTLIPPAPYEGMQLQGLQGLTSAQLETLGHLGASI